MLNFLATEHVAKSTCSGQWPLTVPSLAEVLLISGLNFIINFSYVALTLDSPCKVSWVSFLYALLAVLIISVLLFDVLCLPKDCEPLESRDHALFILCSQHLALLPAPSPKDRTCIQYCLFNEWVNLSWKCGIRRWEFQCVNKAGNSWDVRPSPLPGLSTATWIYPQTIGPQLWGWCECRPSGGLS